MTPHPIHLHLVRFQILARSSFDVSSTRPKANCVTPATPFHPSPTKPKDTLRANSGMVTRIIIKLEGYVGRYVWHCHVLEHEDNDMMRPYDVRAQLL